MMLNRYYRRIKRNRLIWLSAAVVIILFLCMLFLFTDVLAPFGAISPMRNPSPAFLETICTQTDNTQSVYVELKDRTIYYTGIQWGTEQAKRDVCMIQQNGKWIVLLPSDPIEKGRVENFSGYFSAEYGIETTQKLIDEVISNRQYVLSEKNVIPVVLEEISFTSTMVLTVIYFVVLLVLLSVFFVCLVQMIAPRHSNTIQKLSFYGDVDHCIQMIDAELSQSEWNYPIYTKNWIFARGGFAMLELIPFFDIVWYHQSQLKNPGGEDSFGLVFYCYSRKRPVICWSTVESEISEMKALSERLEIEMPWIDPEYRKEKSRLWRLDKKAFLQKYGRKK